MSHLSKIVTALLLSCAALLLASPAAALNADSWRGGWRTPLGDAPHIYEFVIRGQRVTGVYCRNCSDATTIGFVDGQLVVTHAGSKQKSLMLIKDPRGADPGGAPAYHLPPGTPPAVAAVAVRVDRRRRTGRPDHSRRCGPRTSSARGSPRLASA